jgi:putative (di)nucleoside polyphosphate hydrolase
MIKRRQNKVVRTQTFRAGVGAIVSNENGEVLGLERKDISDAWQLPQGGLHENETPLEAVKREILEETGLGPGNLELLATCSRLLAYELPVEARSQKTGRGQVQYWFLFRFTGQDKAITLGDNKEFKDWKWMLMDSLAAQVVSFKQPVYQELAREFKLFLG